MISQVGFIKECVLLFYQRILLFIKIIIMITGCINSFYRLVPILSIYTL